MKILQTQDGAQSAARAHLPGREGHRGSLRGTGPHEGGAEDAGIHQAQPLPARARAGPRRRHGRSPRPWPSAAISRRRKPEPALFGKGARERAMVEMWNRRMELELLSCVAQAFRHLHPAMAQLEVPQVAAWGEANKPRALEMLQIHGRGAGQAAASSPATTIRSPTSRRWWRSTSCRVARIQRPAGTRRTSRAGTARCRPGRARRPESSGRAARGRGPHEADGGRLRRCVRLGRAAADLLPRRDGGNALSHRLRRHGADRAQPARHRSQLDPDHLHLPSARRPLRRPGVVADPRPACRQAHRAADGRRAPWASRRASRPRRRRCFPAPAACSAATTCSFLEYTREQPLDVGPVRVTPFEVKHPSGAPPYALRFEIDGKVLSFTGDTEWVESLVPAGQRRRPLHHGVLPVRGRAALPHELEDHRSASSTASAPSASCSRTWPRRCWPAAAR